MPNNPSAKKRLRQNIVLRTANRAAKSVLRKSIRRVREAVDAGDIEKAEINYRTAAKKLDQAGAQKLIHPNRSARLKSRLQDLIKRSK